MISRHVRKFSENVPQGAAKRSISISTQHWGRSTLREIWKELDSAHVTKITSYATDALNAQAGITFILDFESSGLDNMDKIIEGLRPLGRINQSPPVQARRFPQKLTELDLIDQSFLQDGDELDEDFPGLDDQEYMDRRQQMRQLAENYSMQDRIIPRVPYVNRDHETWKKVWTILRPLHKKHACDEFLEEILEMRSHGIMTRDYIPQLQDFNQYLLQKTNFRLKPAAGVLSSRDFLNALAFRVFYCKPYIRHHSQPFKFLTCDVVDDLMCTVPLYANQEFADFAQLLGLASLGANSELLEKLKNIYQNAVEYGLIWYDSDKTVKKILGARILANPVKIKHSMAQNIQQPWQKEFGKKVNKVQHRPIDSIQYSYFTMETLPELKEQIQEYSKGIDRPFGVGYNKSSSSIEVDRALRLNQFLSK